VFTKTKTKHTFRFRKTHRAGKNTFSENETIEPPIISFVNIGRGGEGVTEQKLSF